MSGFLESLLQKPLQDLFVLTVAGVAWAGLGAALALYWNVRQRRRELDLVSAENFHSLYGEYFAVWKLWSYCATDRTDLARYEDRRWELLTRAANAEAGIEAILGKLASQRDLEIEAVVELGKFRQGFQSLRERIKTGQPEEWTPLTYGKYLAFKCLATKVASLIHSGRRVVRPQAKARADAWVRVTSGEWKDCWWQNVVDAAAIGKEGHPTA